MAASLVGKFAAVTASEEWFDEYLGLNGYSYLREPDLGISKRPDRVITRVGVEAICEVKEFTTDAMRRRFPDGGGGVASFSSAEWMRVVTRQIRRAATKLEQLADDPRPLVIVLANPNPVIAEIDGPRLMEAIEGELQAVVNRETGETTWALSGRGLFNQHPAPWVSAVCGLFRVDRAWEWEREWIERWHAENWPEGPPAELDAYERVMAYQEELAEARARADPPTSHVFRIDVVETISESAVPLPGDIFDGERDRRWNVNRENGTYERVR